MMHPFGNLEIGSPARVSALIAALDAGEDGGHRSATLPEDAACAEGDQGGGAGKGRTPAGVPAAQHLLDEEGARLLPAVAERVGTAAERAQVAQALSEVPLLEPTLLRLLDLDEEGFRQLLAAGADALSRFCMVASQSGVYGRLLVQEPVLLWRHAELCRELEHRAEALIAAASSACDTDPEMMDVLRRWKRYAMLEVVEAEVTQSAPVEETAGRIAAIAARTLDWATRYACRREEAESLRFCVLGMGKLGAGELNLSSDVDLIYVMDPEEGAPVERAVAVARRLTSLIGDATAQGPVFRVDLRLRPFGTQGPLVQTVSSLRDYYEAHGRTWERGALIRMAPVAGALEVGVRIGALLRPFVYRRYLDASAIAEVAAMKRAVEARGKGGRDATFDVKLGEGGIREVEFFVQAFQLVYGGRHPELQVRGTLDALRRLSELGLVPERELLELLEAYRFLRLLEHRIMMEEERQTHTLPSGQALERLSRRMGFKDAEAFIAVLDRYRASVSEPFARLFGDDPGRSRGWLAGVLTAEDDEEAEGLLMEAGVTRSRGALRDLRRLAAPPDAMIGDFAPGPVRRAVEGLLEQCGATADPDRALERCVHLLDSRQARGTLLGILQARPQASVVLAAFFSAAEELGRFLVRSPGYLESVMAAAAAPMLSREALEEVLQGRLVAANERGIGTEGRLVELRRFRRGEELRIALGLLSGRLGLREATQALSDVAELCLMASLREAVKSMGDRAPRRALERIAVVAMGKLGGRELGFGADLDLVFVFDGDIEDSGAFARLVQRWISYLTTPMAYGALYPVDMRMRPDGQQGAVVTSVGAFSTYHRERAWSWERLALVRARVLAEGEPLRRKVQRVIRESLDALDPGEARQAMRTLRAKRLDEAQGAAAGNDVKSRSGGLIDLEWSLQLAWLETREVGAPGGVSSWGLIEALAAAGRLDAAAQRECTRVLELYRGLEVWIRLSEGEDRSTLPPEGARRAAIAARVVEGVGDAARRLDEALDEAGDRVRKLVSEWWMFEDAPGAPRRDVRRSLPEEIR